MYVAQYFYAAVKSTDLERVTSAGETTVRAWSPCARELHPALQNKCGGSWLRRYIPRLRVVSGSQESKRRELNDKMQNLVSRSESNVAQQALQWNTVSRSMASPRITSTVYV